MDLLDFGKQKMPSVVNNPFSKTCINEIRVIYRDFWDDGNWKATGYVDFRNGSTDGTQKFEGESFDEVVRKIKLMIENL